MRIAAEKWRDKARRLRERVSPLIPRVERDAVFELLSQGQMNQPPRSPDLLLRVDRVTADNLTDVLQFRNENVLQAFRQYLADKDIGVYAYWDGLAVGHVWAALWHGSKRFVGGYLPVDVSTACMHFSSVSPSYRGHKIYQNMLVELAKIVFESTPVRRILISCSVDNLASYSAIERVGFRRLLILPVLRWGGRTIRFARIPKVETDNTKVFRS